MAGNKTRIAKYRKRRNINIGVIIFGVTFIYILINVFLYISRDQITIFEVVEGRTGSTSDSYHDGLILREETPLFSSVSGYINFFLRNTSHVSVGTGLYTIDESGQLAAVIAQRSEEEGILTQDSISGIRERINEFTLKFVPSDFASVYELKYSMEALIVENYNTSLLNSVDAASLPIISSQQVGTFLNYTDGYEALTVDSLTLTALDSASYTKNTASANDLVESGSPIGKIVTSDNWSLVIQFNESEYENYKDKTSLKIKFIDSDIETYADLSFIEKDGIHYGILHFDKYGVHYLNNRFLKIKILHPEITGYKVPKSSVVEKEFYIIPVEYLTMGGNKSEKGFNKKIFISESETSVAFISPDIYFQSEDYCYVEKSAFEKGDILIKNDSSDQYQIDASAPLKGVYNVNNGYTNFRQIVILGETSDYYIVARNTSFGLRIYDNIILDVKGIDENQVVYR